VARFGENGFALVGVIALKVISTFLKTVKRTFLRFLPPAVAGRLRTWRVQRLIAKYPVRVVRHTYGSSPLAVYLSDPLAEGWYDHDWPDLPEIAALRHSRLRTGALVFDIGAHQGIVAMMLAREVGPKGQVVAVEPNPHNAAVAFKNRELNCMNQIEIVRSAVSDRRGELLITAGLNGQLDDGSGAGGRVHVQSITVDAMAQSFGMPAVVFVDVEGAECLVLSGASQVLSRGADFFVEVHVGCGLEKFGSSPEQVFSYFPPDRFELLIRAEEDSTFRPLSAGDTVTKNRFFLLALAR
jgi:FkbM family methyltransferase